MTFSPPPLRRFRCLSIPLLALVAAASLSAAGRLVSGPMLGYVVHREALVWVEVADAREVAIEFAIEGRPETARRLVQRDPAATPAGVQPVKFVLPLLEMGTRYTYRLFVDGAPIERPYPLAFTTQDQFEWRRPPDDFSFLIGSCAYINDPPYDRPGRPYGQGTEIFLAMAASGAQFMVWMGDNVYLRESDWTSASGIYYRWTKDRSDPNLQPFLAAMPHLAIWDDHDFGPNNSNRSYALKHVALEAFQAYWGNRTWGEPDHAGIYGTWEYQDAYFILLDNRYHRDDSEMNQEVYPDKSQYGRRQMEWLRSQLAGLKVSNSARHHTFRFIVTGNQFLSERTFPGNEGHQEYRREREEILEMIRAHDLPGVIFLTGDAHYTQLLRRDDLMPYPLYDLTCSALSAGPNTRDLPEPQRVEGTLLQENNYAQLYVSGPLNDRTLRIVARDRTGAARWEHSIRARDLWPEGWGRR